MNGWLIAATIVAVLVLACVIAAAAGGALDALVALELGGMLAAADLLLISEGFHRQPFADLALVLGALSFVGALVFLRFLREARG